MDDNTPNLSLPYIMAAQAQKHVTHNEALRALDAIVQIGVEDQDLTAPPASPANGERHIVAAAATGEWAGEDRNIAAYQDGAWAFYVPHAGWLAWVLDENVLIVWDGTNWVGAGGGAGGGVNPTPLVGVNATADTTNRLSLNSPASLFNHDGNGHQQKINKASVSDTASQLYQTAFSGRAEIGLTGDDDFHFKVSPDGSTFHEAIVIDKDTGAVAFPKTENKTINHLINGDFAINQRSFAGGALVAGSYGFDRWKADTGGATVSVSGDTITLTSGTIVQIIETPRLAGKQVTLSVEDLTGGDLDIDIEGQTAAIVAGADRHGVSVSVPSGSTGNITVKVSPATGVVTFKRMKLENGVVASAWVARPAALEIMLCQRYYERLSGDPGDRYIRRGYGTNTGAQYFPIQFFAKKRVAPTVSLVNASSTNANSAQAFNPSVYEFEFYQVVTTGGGFTFFGYEADAEL